MAKGKKKDKEPDDPAQEGDDKPYTTLRVRRERGSVITGIAGMLGISTDKLFERPEVVSFFNHLGILAAKELQERLQSEVEALPPRAKPKP